MSKKVEKRFGKFSQLRGEKKGEIGKIKVRKIKLKKVSTGWECLSCKKVLGAFPDELKCPYCGENLIEKY